MTLLLPPPPDTISAYLPHYHFPQHDGIHTPPFTPPRYTQTDSQRRMIVTHGIILVLQDNQKLVAMATADENEKKKFVFCKRCFLSTP